MLDLVLIEGIDIAERVVFEPEVARDIDDGNYIDAGESALNILNGTPNDPRLARAAEVARDIDDGNYIDAGEGALNVLNGTTNDPRLAQVADVARDIDDKEYLSAARAPAAVFLSSEAKETLGRIAGIAGDIDDGGLGAAQIVSGEVIDGSNEFRTLPVGDIVRDIKNGDYIDAAEGVADLYLDGDAEETASQIADIVRDVKDGDYAGAAEGLRDILESKPNDGTVEIAEGDTLPQIAARHGTTVDDLLAANPHIADQDFIHAGERVALPEGVQPFGTSQQEKLREFSLVNNEGDQLFDAMGQDLSPVQGVNAAVVAAPVATAAIRAAAAEFGRALAMGLAGGAVAHGVGLAIAPTVLTLIPTATGGGREEWPVQGFDNLRFAKHGVEVLAKVEYRDSTGDWKTTGIEISPLVEIREIKSYRVSADELGDALQDRGFTITDLPDTSLRPGTPINPQKPKYSVTPPPPNISTDESLPIQAQPPLILSTPISEEAGPSIHKIMGQHSGRPFDPDKAGGPILDLDYRDAKVSYEGIADVELHVGRFAEVEADQVMLERLRNIADGEIQPTDYDLRFYTHERRELERYRNLGVEDGIQPDGDLAWELWNDTHTATLEDFKLRDKDENGDSNLYHPDAWEYLQ